MVDVSRLPAEPPGYTAPSERLKATIGSHRIKVGKPVAYALVLLVAMAGCSSGDTGDVDQVTASFVRAVQDGDGATACALLAPTAVEGLASGGQSCEEAVLGVRTGGSAAQVQVWGDEAEVRTGDDVIFLMRLAVGWRVRAAGCTTQPDRPYRCDVEA